VHCSNLSAIEFYKNAGFIIKKELKNYYTDLDPPDCLIFEKDLTEFKKANNIADKK
jgi:ribosomal protein S18 acetylase RimI-like enzyme